MSYPSEVADSLTEAGKGKRDRLVAGAAEVLHRQGVRDTTLAEIAAEAEVPPGNVYYYFKTRDELVAAVIASHAETMQRLLDASAELPDPAERLKGLVRSWSEAADLVAAHGCPIGSLCSELNKLGGGLERDAAGLLGTLIAWAEEQFTELGCEDADELAVTLIAGVQGATLLADSFGDPALLVGQVTRLERWIDSVVGGR
jgi:AcrR family transcriptional regulator